MSNTPASSYTPEDVAEIQALLVNNYIYVALMALVLYDYVITFAQEVQYIWCYSSGQNKKSDEKTYIGALLFLGNRYVAILYGVIGFFVDLFPVTTSCNALTRLTEAILLALMLLFAFFSAYRIYAAKLWNYRIFAPLVFLLDLVPFATNLYAFSLYKPAQIGPSFAPCAIIDPLSPDLEIQYMYVLQGFRKLARPDLFTVVRASRLSSIAADAIVLFLICGNYLPGWLEACKMKRHFRLGSMLIKDGAPYFLILLMMNIAQMVTFAILEIEYLTSFIYIMTPLMSCHLILHIRQCNEKRNSDIYKDISQQLEALGWQESEAAQDVPPLGVEFDMSALENLTGLDSSMTATSCSQESPTCDNLSIREISYV